METTETLQKIKCWLEPVPLHSPKDHTQGRKHHGYVQETKPFTHQRDSKILEKERMVNISQVNACLITNKVSQFHLEICNRNTDIWAITETWIKQDDIDVMTKEVPPQGYKILSRPISGGKTRGGLALVYRDHYFVKELDHTDVVTMEYQGYYLRFDHITLNLYVIYCLPSSSVPQFCNAFASILESDVLQPVDKAPYLGDFNMHAEDSLNNDTITLIDTLESYNLRNRVTFSMHVKKTSTGPGYQGPI